MIHVVEPWRLAKEFSRIINNWLTPEQLAEANRLNTTPEYTTNSLCATHNYCDSNQAMLDALKAFGVEWESDNNDLCNAAWALAKESEFNPEHIRTEMDGLKQYKAVVVSGGSQEHDRAGEYSDWFKDDAAASEGYGELLQRQGYRVGKVAIGFPCIVVLE